MSEVRRLPRVSAVRSIVECSAHTIQGLEAVVQAASRALATVDSNARGALRMSQTAVSATGTLVPAGDLRSCIESREAHLRSDLKGIEGARSLATNKALILSALGSAPLATTADILEAPLRQLDAARSMPELMNAREGLVAAALSGHAATVATSLVAACVAAAETIGFTVRDSLVQADGVSRVVAVDREGRALVSEVRVPTDRDTSVETEVLGDGSGDCHAILERFEEALRAQGVECAGPPERRGTGGVAQTRTARELQQMLRTNAHTEAAEAANRSSSAKVQRKASTQANVRSNRQKGC